MSEELKTGPLDSYIIDHIQKKEKEREEQDRPRIYDRRGNPGDMPTEKSSTPPRSHTENVFEHDEDDDPAGETNLNIDDLLEKREDDYKEAEVGD